MTSISEFQACTPRAQVCVIRVLTKQNDVGYDVVTGDADLKLQLYACVRAWCARAHRQLSGQVGAEQVHRIANNPEE